MFIVWLIRQLVHYYSRRVVDDRLSTWLGCPDGLEVEGTATCEASGGRGVRRARRSVGGHGGTTETEDATSHKDVITGAQALVGKAVDEETDAGMQVRNHWRVQVDWQRKHVELVW